MTNPTSKNQTPIGCPFCGAAAREQPNWRGHYGCSDVNCGAYHAALSWDQWNRRPALSGDSPSCTCRKLPEPPADNCPVHGESPVETKEQSEPGYVPWDDEDVRRFPAEAARIMREQRKQLMELRRSAQETRGESV